MNDSATLPLVNRPETRPSKRTAFTVEPVKVTLVLDLEMAISLGDFILDLHPENPAIAALGHQLQNILPLEKSVQNAE